MPNVVHLDCLRPDSAILRKLPYLSHEAMRYVLAFLVFRSITGRTGIVSLSEVLHMQGDVPKFAIINELFDAGVIGQREDGVLIFHPVIATMLPCGYKAVAKSYVGVDDVVVFSKTSGNKHTSRGVA
jgi:hypothetical protein